MLKENQIKALRMYIEGTYTMQQIAEACGYVSRQSIYDLLKKQEAQELLQEWAEDALKQAKLILQNNATRMAKELVKIGAGQFKDQQKVYAQLQAINSVLEKIGFTSKNAANITTDETENQQEKNQLLEMLKQQKAS